MAKKSHRWVAQAMCHGIRESCEEPENTTVLRGAVFLWFMEHNDIWTLALEHLLKMHVHLPLSWAVLRGQHRACRLWIASPDGAILVVDSEQTGFVPIAADLMRAGYWPVAVPAKPRKQLTFSRLHLWEHLVCPPDICSHSTWYTELCLPIASLHVADGIHGKHSGLCSPWI